MEGTGDISKPCADLAWAMLFQSAPLAEARGDVGAYVPCAMCTPCFNPLPLPKQGEIARRTDRHGDACSVSIRSPCRSKGRSATIRGFEATGLGFNPLPLPKQGEIECDLRVADRGLGVSIRSPCRSKGRYKDRHSRRAAELFQSAPLAEARGDRLTGAAMVVGTTEFQSAPLAEARGDLDDLGQATPAVQFQSAPLAEARGDAEHLEALRSVSPVSIRSPCRSKGRSYRWGVRPRPI